MRSRDQGQATVEFALLLPLAIACLLLVVQTLVVVLAQITVHHEARLAVRAAAIAADPATAAHRAVKENNPQSPSRIDIDADEQVVTVRIIRQIPIVIPIIGSLGPGIEVRAQLTMALEPPLQTMPLS